jgi:hypothetical protein
MPEGVVGYPSGDVGTSSLAPLTIMMIRSTMFTTICTRAAVRIPAQNSAGNPDKNGLSIGNPN